MTFAPPHPLYQRILVPVGGGLASERALDAALRLAAERGARLRLLHILRTPAVSLAMDPYSGHVGAWMNELRKAGQHILDQAMSIAKSRGVGADSVLREGAAASLADGVVSEAIRWPADLIVFGVRPGFGFGRLLVGSSIEHMLRESPVPLLLVPTGRRRPAAAPDATIPSLDQASG